ncbi:Ank-repeat mbp1 [Pyrenophora seminiperda CCB06]|uniref:Ank-repeat mbp1 n=1 Tax=Pyrenophora seminiperda CCB06 TaxID=1302712 RepID=A0A3M7M3F3_9PLEO|nr:Ank-repeat mbp1 [Pyrenophora seminiperda CCB06]
MSESRISSSTSTVQDGQQAAKYLPKTCEFEVMADIISKNVTKILFPASVDAIFDRVISSRREVHKKHTELPKQKRDLKKDRTHEYFTSIIERAYTKLKPYVTEKSRRGNGKPVAPGDGGPSNAAMENSFAGLKVDDSPDLAEMVTFGATEDATDDLPDMPPAQVDMEEEEIENEFHFQILMLLNELHNILQIVVKLWGAYRDGNIDVVVPSLTTNIAIDMVRQAEADFDELVIRPKKYPVATYPAWTIPAVAYHCQLAEFDKNPLEELVKPDMFHHHGILQRKSTEGPAGTEDIFFQSVFCGIKFHLQRLIAAPESIQEPNIAAMKAHHPWWPKLMFRTIGLMHQYQVALTTWKDFTVCRHDEISLGVQYMVETPSKIPLWATFGIQLFLDIQTTLGLKQSQPFEEICKEVKIWKTRFDGGKDADGQYLADGKQREEFIKLIHENLGLAVECDRFEIYNLHDSSGVKSTSDTTTAGFGTPCKREGSYFLKRHPIRCGLMKHHLYSRVLELRFHGSQAQIKEMTWLAHLYIAGRLIEPDLPRWPDMEFAIHRQGLVHLFDEQGLPTTLTQCESKLKKANSFVSSNTPRERWRPDHARLFKNPRLLGDILADQLEDNTSEGIYRALRRFVCDPTNQARLYGQYNTSPETAQTSPPFQLQNEPCFSALLRDFGNYWLRGDVIDLFFDWTRFTRTSCEELIPSIRYLLSNDEKNCPINDFDTDFYEFALWIIDQAVQSEKPEFGTLRSGEWLEVSKVRSSNRRRHLRNVNMFIEKYAYEGVLMKYGDFNTWKGEGGLVKLLGKVGPMKTVFDYDGQWNANRLYEGWGEEQKAKSNFWRALNR